MQNNPFAVNTPPGPSNKLPKWARLTIGIAFLLLLFIGLPWWGINEFARRAWLDTQAMLAREGETLDFRTLLNPPVPEEQNFCAAPSLLGLAAPEGKPGPHAVEGIRNREIIQKLFESKTGAARPNGLTTGRSFALVETAASSSASTRGKPPITTEEAMRRINADLEPREPFLAGLASRLDLKQSQWDPPLSAPYLPQLLYSLQQPEGSPFFHLAQGLRMRAAIASIQGNAPCAVESVRILLRLYFAGADIPTIDSLNDAHLALDFAIQTIWQLSGEQQGTAELWATLESELATCNLPASALHAMRGELTRAANFALYGSEHGISPSRFSLHPPTLLSRVTPKGIYLNNASTHAELCLEYILHPLCSVNWPEVLRRSRDLDSVINNAKTHPFRNISMICSVMTGPMLTQELRRSIYHQSTLNQAIVACALERFRLEHGCYPDSLNSLTLANGSPLPLDPISGESIHYRKTDDQRYRLWCVNLSGTDHDGKRGQFYFLIENTDGDWVWGFEDAPHSPSAQ